ncbi:myogenesis-regulating glycosidase-like isoform X2 [Babylonia areolata]|uniref:myogenesis-regulating glycosidase-like isoform X2 n=1 Tax=Babylonia areolata TaxID=304850 RepID=UPI003FD22829
MDRRSGRNTDIKGLEEEEETLLKDSDTQEESCAAGHCASDTCNMFRSRPDQDKGAAGGRHKDVNIPLVRDRDSDEAAAVKAVQAQESKRRKRRIMKIAVYVMFGIIALGVFAIWLFHKDAIESIRFNNFVFTVKVQTLEIKTDDQEGLLYGELGRHIKAAPFQSCWDEDSQSYEDNCLYWKNKAVLRVAHDDNVTGRCYTLHWQGIQAGFVVEDCFYLQKYNWFGYLRPDQSFWPISDIQVTDESYYVWYPAKQKVNLVPSWLGSQGIALFVHGSFPFSLSWNDTEKRQFCLISQLEVEEDGSEAPDGVDQLAYTICQGTDLKEVYYHAQSHRHSWEEELQKTPHTIQPLLWPMLGLRSRAEIGPLLSVLRSNLTRCSFLQLPVHWERHFGDLRFDPALLHELRPLMTLTRDLGCDVVLPISTFFTFNSRLFEEGVEKQYFLRDELNLVTKMVRWQDREGAVLDTTNQEAVSWYLQHLNKLLNNSAYNIHSLKLLHIDVPRDANYYDSNMTFLDYSRLFYRDASLLLNVTLILEQATGFVSEPVFLSLSTDIHTVGDAQCFNSVIPWALNLGVSGYPLILADGAPLQEESPLSVELFKRWLQLIVFFPAVHVPNLPLLTVPEVIQYIEELITFRQRILHYMNEEWARDHEAPILRPLWWAHPQDAVAQTVSDQFLVGSRLLVAPILCHPTDHRHVYLPAGKWRDGNHPHNKTHVGPKTVHITNVQISMTIFFWKVADTD